MAGVARIALLGLLRKAGVEGDADFLREAVRVLAQALLEAEVSAHVGRSGTSVRPSGPGSATAIASARGTRAWGPST